MEGGGGQGIGRGVRRANENGKREKGKKGKREKGKMEKWKKGKREKGKKEKGKMEKGKMEKGKTWGKGGVGFKGKMIEKHEFFIFFPLVLGEKRKD